MKKTISERALFVAYFIEYVSEKGRLPDWLSMTEAFNMMKLAVADVQEMVDSGVSADDLTRNTYEKYFKEKA